MCSWSVEERAEVGCRGAMWRRDLEVGMNRRGSSGGKVEVWRRLCEDVGCSFWRSDRVVWRCDFDI